MSVTVLLFLQAVLMAVSMAQHLEPEMAAVPGLPVPGLPVPELPVPGLPTTELIQSALL